MMLSVTLGSIMVVWRVFSLKSPAIVSIHHHISIDISICCNFFSLLNTHRNLVNCPLYCHFASFQASVEHWPLLVPISDFTIMHNIACVYCRQLHALMSVTYTCTLSTKCYTYHRHVELPLTASCANLLILFSSL